IAATGDIRRSSVLSVLVYEKKVLREEDVLHHVVDDHGVGVIDLRGYEVPDDVKNALDIGACWATWTVPFDREEDFHFVATAYYLSPAVRAHWEKTLGGQIIWQATTMDIIADFLDRVQAERTEAAKRTESGAPALNKSGTRSPFTSAPFTGAPGGSGSAAPFVPPPTGGSVPPFPRVASNPPHPPPGGSPPPPSP
ncbi:MAG: hypothetical protein HYV75_01330, partial [Opitutae bacterium]|nr:hypothetical protein [Opitutae bacterium]